MTEVPFHATRMGQQFYEHTLPELVRQLQRLNEVLERIADTLNNDELADSDEDDDL